MVVRPADLGYSKLLVEPFARALGAPGLAERATRRISVGEAHHSLQRLVEQSGDTRLGLRAGCSAVHGDAGALDYAIHTAATVRDALRTASRYMRVLNGELHFTLDESPAALLVQMHSAMLDPPPAEDYLLSAFYRVHLRRLLPEGSPVRCHLVQRAPTDLEPHRQALAGARLEFGAAVRGFDFDRSLLDLPLNGRDPKLHAILRDQLERELRELPSSHTYSERVRALLGRETPLETTTLPLVADALQLSVRTLSRRLQAEGATFGALLDDVRRKRALRHLQERELSIGEIARDLGFSRGSAFDRAFKRWTGAPPSHYRAAR